MKKTMKDMLVKCTIEDELGNYLKELRSADQFRRIRTALENYSRDSGQEKINLLLSEIIKLDLTWHLLQTFSEKEKQSVKVREKFLSDSYKSYSNIIRLVGEISNRSNVIDIKSKT